MGGLLLSAAMPEELKPLNCGQLFQVQMSILPKRNNNKQCKDLNISFHNASFIKLFQDTKYSDGNYRKTNCIRILSE